MKNEANIEIMTGIDVTNCNVEKENPRLKINDQDTDFDLVVVADGRNSIRKNIKGVVSYEKTYPFGCLHCVLPDNDAVFTSNNQLFQRLDGAKIMLGFLPTGRTQDMKDTDHTLVSLFWSLEMANLEAVRSAGLDSWKQQVQTVF